jgi:hypothetical protein
MIVREGPGIDEPLILNNTSVPAAVAFSSRKLRSEYTGSALKVRRSSDNTTQDIGFRLRELDTAALATFVGSGSGFVDTFYDQSGSGLNATQTTLADQPRIVLSGANDTLNSHVAMRFTGGTMALSTPSTINQPEPVTICILTKRSSGIVSHHITDGVFGSPRMLIGEGAANAYQFYSGGTPSEGGLQNTTDTRTIIGVFSTPSSSLYVEGTAVISGASIGSDGFGSQWVGAGSAQLAMDGWLGEYLVFFAALGSSDRTKIRSDWQSYWGAV